MAKITIEIITITNLQPPQLLVACTKLVEELEQEIILAPATAASLFVINQSIQTNTA